MRKTTLLVLLLAALVPSHSYADIISDMIGNWSGKSAVYDGRTKIADATVTTKIVRYGKRGTKSTGSVRIPGEPVTTSVGWNNDDGTALGVVRQGGRTIAVVEGRWRIQGSQIISTGVVRSLIGDYTQTVRTVRVNARRFDSRGTTSVGLSVVGSVNKTQ
jgi:hypothetical protein